MTKGHVLFGDLLDGLRDRGFDLGPHDYVRVQQLFERIPYTFGPDRVKTLMAPIIARRGEEQQRFYEVFDQLYTTLSALSPPQKSTDEPRRAAQAPSGVVAQQRTDGRPGFALRLIRGPASWLALAATLAVVAVSSVTIWSLGQFGSAEIDQPRAAGPTAAQAPPQPTTTPGSDTTIPRVTPSPSLEAEARDPFTAPTIPTDDPEISQVGSSEPAPPLILVQDILRWLVVVVPLGLLAWLEWRASRRRREAIERHQSKRAPLTWPITMSPNRANFDTGDLRASARELRRREPGEAMTLAVEPTIAATVRARGFPVLRFRAARRAPEYLVLIERSGHRDHQARLFDDLVRALRDEDVQLLRFYYEGDPRICIGDGERRWRLTDLRSRYPASRVLVFGQGNPFLHPVTGAPHRWMDEVIWWQHQALLTPVAPSAWSAREVSLAKHFAVVPATLAGLRALIDRFNPEYDPVIRAPRGSDSTSTRPIHLSTATADDLETYLGPEGFRWLCATALYPELHWDLTLVIGRMIAKDNSAMDEETLLKLVRLPWFRTGAIPDDLRLALIERLDEATELAVRRQIIDTLEGNIAPEESVVGEQQRLHIAVQRFFAFRRNRKKHRAALKQLRRFPHELVGRDRAVLHLIESAPRSPLSFLLPSGVRSVLYRDGIWLFGMRSAGRVGTAGVAMLAGLFVLRAPNPIDDLAVELPDIAQSTCEIFGSSYNADGECFDEPPRPLAPTSVPIPADAPVPSAAVLAVRVGLDGVAGEVIVTRPSDDPFYDSTAIARARVLAYSPAQKSGVPVTAWTEEAFFPEPEQPAVPLAASGTTGVQVPTDAILTAAPPPPLRLTTTLVELLPAERRPLADMLADPGVADSISWRSLAPDIASIDSLGFVVARRSGEATIEAATPSGEISRVLVRVTTLAVRASTDTVRFAIGSEEPVAIFKPTQTQQLVRASEAERSILALQLQWTSTDSTVAAVRPTGEISAIREGTAEILVTGPGGQQQISVIVHRMPMLASGSPQPLTTVRVPVGGAVDFVGYLLDEDSVPINEAIMRWGVEDTSVARYETDLDAVVGLRPGQTRLLAVDRDSLVGMFWNLDVVRGTPRFASRDVRVEWGAVAPLRIGYADGDSVIGRVLEYDVHTLDPSIVEVAGGTVTGVSWGQTSIVMLHPGGASDTTTVTVRPNGVYEYSGELRFPRSPSYPLEPDDVRVSRVTTIQLRGPPSETLTGTILFLDQPDGIDVLLGKNCVHRAALTALVVSFSCYDRFEDRYVLRLTERGLQLDLTREVALRYETRTPEVRECTNTNTSGACNRWVVTPARLFSETVEVDVNATMTLRKISN